jgi:hypothetical protein
MPFHKNVFVNCPFDSDYLSLLRPLLFSLTKFWYRPAVEILTFNKRYFNNR